MAMASQLRGGEAGCRSSKDFDLALSAESKIIA